MTALPFPLPLDAYPAAGGLGAELAARIARDPFNLVASLLFLGAIVHTFFAPALLRLSHRLGRRHRETAPTPDAPMPVKVELLHFLGEVEAVFGIWVIPLALAAALTKGWGPTREYLAHGVDFTEPLFIVVVMVMAASRPVLALAERLLGVLGGTSPARWWAALLTVGPVLGSFITEPAAMTICALLLGKEFFRLQPGTALKYATLGLLFVNISVGGTLSHFAAPPVLMVVGKWGWGFGYVFSHFGVKALLGMAAANLAYFLCFRRELLALRSDQGAHLPPGPVPPWITAVHLGFIAWTVLNNHAPVLFVGGFLFFLAFVQATGAHQRPPDLKPPVLVGFFLAGLVVHGGLQGWWIAPVLGRLGEVPLLLGSAFLTAFNDNAAITYLATLVPNLPDLLKDMVMAGAVAGGGMTVIANAPNPAGQAILGKYFPGGISPLGLACGAAFPTAVMLGVFYLLR